MHLQAACLQRPAFSTWRQHLRRELLAAAKEGRVQDAENTLQSMMNRGVQPGPLAYHGLICAYCKAQDSKGALAAAQRAAQEGEARHAVACTWQVMLDDFG